MSKKINIVKRKWFRTWYNQVAASLPEVNDEPSQTVPHQSYTVREILDRFARGHELPIQYPGHFDPEPDMEIINPLGLPQRDLSDLVEMAEMAAEIQMKNAAKTGQKARGKPHPGAELAELPQEGAPTS